MSSKLDELLKITNNPNMQTVVYEKFPFKNAGVTLMKHMLIENGVKEENIEIKGNLIYVIHHPGK